MYGVRVQKSDSMDCSDDSKVEKPARQPFLLWNNIDCSIQSCYEYDQESPLNTKQIRTVMACFSNIRSFDFSGNISFNNRCLKLLVARNPTLSSLSLRVTKVDYDGLIHLLNKSENDVKYNDTLRELKLTKLLRTSITTNNINFFEKFRNLHSLELINHQYKDTDILKIIQPNGYEPTRFRPFTHLNLSGSTITPELSNVKTLTSLVLEDCGLTPDIAKLLINKLSKLKHLDLSKNNGLTPEVFENLCLTDSITHLKLAGCDISDDAVKNISKSGSISVLELDATKITIRSVKYLFGSLQEETKYVGRIASFLTTLSLRNCSGITTSELKKENLAQQFLKIIKI